VKSSEKYKINTNWILIILVNRQANTLGLSVILAGAIELKIMVAIEMNPETGIGYHIIFNDLRLHAVETNQQNKREHKWPH
jgi:hypothetical protein